MESVERACKVAQFWGHPHNDFEDGVVAQIQILPVQDALVMEDAVAEITDVLPAFVEPGEIPFRRGSVGKHGFG